MPAIVTMLSIGIWSAFADCAAALPPKGIPADAEPFHDLNNKNVEAWASGNHLFLIPNNSAADEKDGIKIARLSNVVEKIHWQPDNGPQVQLHPEPDHWLIKLGEKSEGAAKIIVMELDAPATLFNQAILSAPDGENIITLPAKRAITHGSLLRFEPQPHKNTVGYWANVADTVEWNFHVLQSGTYEVDILQGCGKSHGGSRVDLVIGEQKLSFDVQETGHFQNFIWRTIGTVELPQTDKGVLSLIPVHKAAGAVMDVRSIRLVPTGAKRSFEPELADPAALPREQ